MLLYKLNENLEIKTNKQVYLKQLRKIFAFKTVLTNNIKYIMSITIVFFLLQLCQLILFQPKYNKITTFIAVFDF